MLDNVTAITFATPSHYRFQDKFELLYGNKFKAHIPYSSEWLAQHDFYHDNPQIFQYRKYFGYFLWKPFIIKHALEIAKTDYVLYCDSNLRFTNLNKFEEMFARAVEREGMFLVYCPQYPNSEWTKRDTFVYMDADEPRYWQAPQLWTIIIGTGKSDGTVAILDEYLEYCRDPRIVTEEPNVSGLPNLAGFREHRWEQSILTILAQRHGLIGVLFSQAARCIDKVYDAELYKLKASINPLEVVE